MLKGSIVALVTPFHSDGSVNFEKLGELLDWHVENGTDAILSLGTTGESSTMTQEEDDAVVRFTIDRINHRIPVIVGAGSNDTQAALARSLKYEEMGADYLLLITPYYNKANDEGMIRHFTAIADQVHTPIILYNVPGRTGCSLSVKAVETLALHRNIVGIKEASGNISYVASIAHLVNEHFALYSGNDDMIVPIMSLGGSGVISVFADVCPKESHEMVHAWLDGDIERSRKLQLKYLDFIHKLFIEVNPIPVKEAMNLMGWDVGGYRLPLCEMSVHNRKALMESMKKVGLL